MSNVLSNILVLVICWVAATGVGAFLTYRQQPNELKRLEDAERVARSKDADVAALLAEEAGAAEQAEDAVRRWKARYKVIPDSLHSYEVVAYLNELSQDGFESINLSYEGQSYESDYRVHSFGAQGRAYFASLYGFIRALENNRHFYGIRGLQLEEIDLIKPVGEEGRTRMQVMVSFNMTVDAYFGAVGGASAPNSELLDLLAEQNGLPSVSETGLPPVPAHVLPSAEPALNPFFPLVMEQLPPNTLGLIEVDNAELVSIAGGKAVFKEGEKNAEPVYRTAGVGDAVYLGQVTYIDPKEGYVVVQLNRGGLIDEVKLELVTGERYRQALGPVQLAPVQ